LISSANQKICYRCSRTSLYWFARNWE